MKLIIASGPNKGTIFDVRERRVTIGRAHANHVVLYDRRVSAYHAELTTIPDGVQIRDLGSSNGTYVNGLLVNRATLRPGDTVHLGDTVLAFERLPADAAARAPFAVVADGADGQAAIQATVRKAESSTFVPSREGAADVDDLREDRRKLLALYRVNSVINSVRDTHELLCRVLEEVFDALNAERGFVVLLDEETGELIPAAMRRRHADDNAPRVSISQSIARHVIDHGEAVLSTDAARDRRFSSADSVAEAGIRSAMCAPLHGRDRLQGIIYVDNLGSQAAFTRRDLHLLTAMANQLGTALENARLAEARLADERFAAIGQAVAGLSHYIKNILGCMQGGGQIVQRGLDLDEVDMARRGWDIVRRNERRISELVLDMLNYSGAGVPLRESCQLNDMVREIAEGVGADTTKQLEVKCDLAPDLPRAEVDQPALHRCLLNLVSNAIDALPNEGGLVRFITRHDPAKKTVRVSVADNGCGIEPDILPAIFDVFFSTKGSKGTGLGLAVLHKLIQEHGGDVEVDSSPGEGTTITLILPITPPPSPDKDMAES